MIFWFTKLLPFIGTRLRNCVSVDNQAVVLPSINLGDAHFLTNWRDLCPPICAKCSPSCAIWVRQRQSGHLDLLPWPTQITQDALVENSARVPTRLPWPVCAFLLIGGGRQGVAQSLLDPGTGLAYSGSPTQLGLGNGFGAGVFAEDALLGAVPRACAAPQEHGVDSAAKLCRSPRSGTALSARGCHLHFYTGGGKQLARPMRWVRSGGVATVGGPIDASCV